MCSHNLLEILFLEVRKVQIAAQAKHYRTNTARFNFFFCYKNYQLKETATMFLQKNRVRLKSQLDNMNYRLRIKT
jgi:hypothetical protein